MKLSFVTIALFSAAVSALPNMNWHNDWSSHTTKTTSTPAAIPKTKTETTTTTVTAYKTITACSSGPTPSGEKWGKKAPKTHTVKVGGRDGATAILKYDPPTVDAHIGDTIVFDFLFRNHTVTESSFDNPCEKLDGGFASGFLPNLENIPGTVNFTYSVVDTKPHWVYCGQKQPQPHCQQGMVFTINAPKTGNTFEAFLSAAKAAPTIPSTPSAPVPAQPKKTHAVVVGGKPSPSAAPVLRYSPETVEAAAGDVVEFNFRANAHTVTQSSFENPCTGIDGGFKTGLQNNTMDVDRAILREFVVPKTDAPLWFYCGAPTHCQKGMVFAINAPTEGERTFEKFQKAAMASA